MFKDKQVQYRIYYTVIEGMYKGTTFYTETIHDLNEAHAIYERKTNEKDITDIMLVEETIIHNKIR